MEGKQTIGEKIQQRRLQILVHSYIYYALDQNIVSDETWMKWAKDLVYLQEKYPEIAKSVIYSEAFDGFDGSTGFDLPYNNEQIIGIANRLLASKNKTVKPKTVVYKKPAQQPKPKTASRQLF